MTRLLHQIVSVKLPESLRLLMLVVCYSLLLTTGLVLAYLLRFEFSLVAENVRQLMISAGWIVPTSLAALWSTGQFRSLLSYFSVPDLKRIVIALGVVTVAAFAVWEASDGRYAPPRSIIITNWMWSGGTIIGFRLGLRILRERYYRAPSAETRLVERVGILGATDIGAHLAREIKLRSALHMSVVAFFDPDPRQTGRLLHGVPILGDHTLLLEPDCALNISRVIIALPHCPPEELKVIVKRLIDAGIHCDLAPASTVALSAGKSLVRQIRPVQIEDLLGREAVQIDHSNLNRLIKGRCVAVTGAGGSIGSELCRQILTHDPAKLVLIEQCEVQLFFIEQELLAGEQNHRLVACVADVLDEARIDQIFTTHRPVVVFHAAAHKHVPLMEHQPAEAIQNNVIGTWRLLTAARATGVERFVLISSDKAINPTNVMGATKRLAEILTQATFAARPAGPKLAAVRFGNVLGSSGSVIPVFRRQIAAGGPVTVTHPEVTRYFMTVNEAVALVLQSAALSQGGEIFVLDMGQPVRIADLARQLITLSGLEPETDIAIKFTGLRPGEKLYEELSHGSENHVPTAHAKIMRFLAPHAELASVEQALQDLHARAHSLTPNDLKLRIKNLVPEYQPDLTPHAV